ncbi:VIT domain-containing protein [Hyalangium minutum]|uniref:VIT domain-containing protein n=1 Tax=Hyalangium minutum TaxID=394096 RepID=A0A085WVV7_9BACT|nr:VIT domain-containing protein [Hyalangium minutum]KFE71820.1 hypothetical protein DB31_0081 [Hyalangium minutum]
MTTARCCFLVSLLLLSLPARAQDNQKAGLFTEARQLPLVSQSLYVDARGEDAEVRLVQVFHNAGPELGQADYQLHLPEGATVVSFGFWQGERFLAAELKEKGEAEAAHEKAAGEGRATALLKTDAGVQRFSVYPVREGALQRVEVTLRVPVAREMGRSQVALAVDRFLGQGRAASSVVVDVQTEEPLADVGVEGARFAQLGRSERGTRLVFSTDKPVEVWWSEKGAPLSYGADAVKLEDGSSAVGLRVALNNAGEWRAPYKELRLYVDASFSMRRRRAALEALVDRLQDQSAAPVRVFAVGDTVREQRASGDAAAVVKALLDGTAGHTTHGASFARAMDDARCRTPEVRCVGVTDLQLAGFEQILPLLPSFVFLADAHERAFMEGQVPLSARVFDPEVEAMAKLRAQADELVLPVLEVTALTQDGHGVEPMGSSSRRVAEGGLLRLFFLSTSEAPLEVAAHIEGRQVGRQVPVTVRSPESPEGRAVRRGYFERQLATWMAAYKRSPDPELKQRIIETSLKEKIPTAFTALQVSSPELSLDSIKPGDPLLTARVEPGLEEVTAWYPFGEARRLVYDAKEGVFVDRFLVPRGWTDRLYAVEVFKRYTDGRVRQERAWYRLDDAGPAVAVEADTERGVLRITSAEAGQELGGVRLEGANTWTRTLSALSGEWLVPLTELPSAFTVVARDRAGNTVHLAFTWENHTLSAMVEDEAVAVASRTSLQREVPALSVEGQGLRLVGEEVRLTVAGKELRYAHAEAPLTSLALTAVLPLEGGAALFGTQSGELVSLSCAKEMERCTAHAVGTFPSHPVTGLVTLPEGTVLVGVLGEGLKELRGEKLERSKLDVGSVYVTGVVSDGRDVLVGTAYNGLWRVTGGRALRTKFAHPHVLSLSMAAGGVEVASGSGRFLQKGRDRYVALSQLSLPAGSAAMMAAARFEGEVYLGGFDSGLWRWAGNQAEPVSLELDVREAQVNALASFDGALWAGTEAGLLRLSRSGKGLRVERIHEASAHDLAVGPEGLAVATSRGLLVVSAGAQVRRVDLQSGVDAGKFFAVAWQEGTLWAGGMDGLYRFEGGRGERLGAAEGYRGGWVTALLTRGDSVWVGTYASGVYAVKEGRASKVQGLEGQWVPLRALKAVGDTVWVGGLGMPSVRVSADGGKRAVLLPTRDVNDAMAVPGGTLLLTTDGAMLLPGPVATEPVKEVSFFSLPW